MHTLSESVQKLRRIRRPQKRRTILIVFRRSMYVAKNTLRGESVSRTQRVREMRVGAKSCLSKKQLLFGQNESGYA